MGATTYRLMSGFAAEMPDDPSFATLTAMPKVAFSSTLEAPLSWANTELVDRDPVETVQNMKQRDSRPLRTIGSLSLCRSLLEAGVVDRFRVIVFPVITGATGKNGRKAHFQHYQGERQPTCPRTIEDLLAGTSSGPCGRRAGALGIRPAGRCFPGGGTASAPATTAGALASSSTVPPPG